MKGSIFTFYKQVTIFFKHTNLHKISCSRNKSDSTRVLNSKTITIKKLNKITKQYDIRGSVRDPQLVLILKIGKTWGPVGYRKNSLNLTTVLDKQFVRFWTQIFQRFKERSLKFFGVLVVLLLTMSGAHSLCETVSDTYLEMVDLSPNSNDFRFELDDFRFELDDLSPNFYDLWSELDDLWFELDDLSPEPKREDFDSQIDGLIWDFEMGLEIPFIAELDDLNCDIVEIPEGKGAAWDIGWTESSYPFDGEEGRLNTEYGVELGELLSENHLNSIEVNRQNTLAHLSNYQLSYDILDIDGDRFIITNQAIFEAEWLQMIRDLAVDIKVETISGNTVTTLTIDTEVANLLFTDDFLSPRDSLLSNTLASSEGSQLDYENLVRAIRDETVVINSPEFREMVESINGSRALTILEVSPTSPSEASGYNIEDMKELEWRNQMRADWKERISILFSNQNPDYQPMPSWTHIPTKPSEPWAIELWERDNEIRAIWADKLKGGFNQINVVTNGLSEDYYSTNWFYQGYVDPQDLLGPHGIVTNDLMDDYYSTDWFDEGYQDPQDLLGSHDIFEDEDLGLDRLFDES